MVFAAPAKNSLVIVSASSVGLVVLGFVLDAEVDEGNPGLVEREVIRVAGPVVLLGAGDVVTETQHDRRLRDFLEVGLEKRVVRSAGREQQVLRVAPDHVEVDVHHHRVLRHGRCADESARTVQAELLGVERGEDDRVVRRFGGEPCRHREHRGNARRVVVGAVEHLSLDDAEMVVVGRDDDEASGLAAAPNHRDEVDARPLASAAGAAEREGLLERLAIRWRQLRRLEAAQDVLACLG